MPKRLVILCDGTWQSSLSDASANPSNIARLSRAIKNKDKRGSDPIDQIVYYHPGLGTDVGPFRLGRNLLAGLFGWGILQHLKDVYSFISYNYEVGDELIFFGFSRGAFLVRAINGFIADFGILQKPGLSEFSDIFSLYSGHPFRENVKLLAIQKILIRNNVLIDPSLVKVKVLGCFDTIGALGIPRVFPFQRNRYEFLNLSLTPNVEFAFHALALDETRKPFKPTLWFFPPDHDRTKYKQVWFTGTHVNIGGGDCDHCQKGTNFLFSRKDCPNCPNVLSDGSLIWMVSECQDLLEFDTGYLHVNIVAGHTKRDGQMDYNIVDGKRAHQPVPESRQHGPQPIWYLGPLCNNFAGLLGKFYLLTGTKPRTVGKYENCQKVTTHNYLKRLWTHCVGDINVLNGKYVTHESVHESVPLRMLRSGKSNKSLEDVVLTEPESTTPAEGSVPVLKFSQFEETFWREENQNVMRSLQSRSHTL